MCHIFAIPELDGLQVLSASDSNYKNLKGGGMEKERTD